jgi:hypothetical protein
MPFFCLKVDFTKPMTEKMEIAKPARKGVNPVPGLWKSPTP